MKYEILKYVAIGFVTTIIGYVSCTLLHSNRFGNRPVTISHDEPYEVLNSTLAANAEPWGTVIKRITSLGHWQSTETLKGVKFEG